MNLKYSISQVRQEVNELLQKYESRDPVALCQDLGISLYERNDFRDLKGMYAHVLGRPCIFIKADLPPELYRVVLAHELGHDRLHRELLSHFKILHDRTFFEWSSQPEMEANLFAAELLIPDDLFLERAYDGWDLDQLAASFGLPRELLSLKTLLLREQGLPFKLPDPAASDFLSKV